MGLRDLGFWGRMAGEFANSGMDKRGARKCASKGHKWHDVRAVVLLQDGGIEERARGAAQRCRRCGLTREAPAV